MRNNFKESSMIYQWFKVKQYGIYFKRQEGEKHLLLIYLMSFLLNLLLTRAS